MIWRLFIFVFLSSFSFGQSADTSVTDNSISERLPHSVLGELFRDNLEPVEGFYKTYDDFLNQRITDTVEFFLDNDPLIGENKLFVVTTNPQTGKTKFKKFDISSSTYWGARINNMSIGYRDFRFYDSKALEILLAGDIWMYSTGGFHVQNGSKTESAFTTMRNQQWLPLKMKNSIFDGSLVIAREKERDYDHKEMTYIQKGLDGDLTKFRGVSKQPLLDLFMDKKEIHDSFKSIKSTLQVGCLKEAYMYIDIYNHSK